MSNIKISIDIDFRPAKARAVRRFIPMMWIDQVRENSLLYFNLMFNSFSRRLP